MGKLSQEIKENGIKVNIEIKGISYKTKHDIRIILFYKLILLVGWNEKETLARNGCFGKPSKNPIVLIPMT